MSTNLKVKVLFFAQFRETLRKTEETLVVEAGSSAADLLRRVVSDVPALRDLSARVAIAVNRKVVPPKTVLADGDEVTFLPPMTGG
jgi:molybdopterin synthase sulfur carrier subunit